MKIVVRRMWKKWMKYGNVGLCNQNKDVQIRNQRKWENLWSTERGGVNWRIRSSGRLPGRNKSLYHSGGRPMAKKTKTIRLFYFWINELWTLEDGPAREHGNVKLSETGKENAACRDGTEPTTGWSLAFITGLGQEIGPAHSWGYLSTQTVVGGHGQAGMAQSRQARSIAPASPFSAINPASYAHSMTDALLSITWLYSHWWQRKRWPATSFFIPFKKGCRAWFAYWNWPVRTRHIRLFVHNTKH